MNKIKSQIFFASDGVRLHYLQAGSGMPIVMVPGAGLSADIFMPQIIHLSQHYRVISLDKRGHGQSEQVNFGYRVSRLAKDLHDLFQSLDLKNVILIGHSLGAAIVYNYIDLFGSDRIIKFIVIDEPVVLLINPIWSEIERQQYGCIYDAGTLHQLTNGFTNTNANSFSRQLIDKMTTRFATAEQKLFILKCMEIPGFAATQLYFNNLVQDFRDVLRKINVPTLFITGKASLHPWQSHQWMSEQVPQAQLTVFEENEGGNHFLFVENPIKFNQVIDDFLNNTNNEDS